MVTHGSHINSAPLLLLLKLLALLVFPTACLAQNTRAGVGVAERYWDCCKPDCTWAARADFNQPVRVCDIEDKPLSNDNLPSGCGGGPSYACSNQSPWAVNSTFSYGYAGVFLIGRAADSWCCSCYELTFTSGRVAGKKMVVQAHNSGFDLLTANRFALAIPGGNTSFAAACATQFGVSNDVFGAEGEGVASIDDCDGLPKPHQAGCRWRFEWFENEARPAVNYTRVRCPAVLTNRTNCIRNDEDSIDEPGAAPSTTATSFSTLTVTILATVVFGGIILIAF